MNKKILFFLLLLLFFSLPTQAIEYDYGSYLGTATSETVTDLTEISIFDKYDFGKYLGQISFDPSGNEETILLETKNITENDYLLIVPEKGKIESYSSRFLLKNGKWTKWLTSSVSITDVHFIDLIYFIPPDENIIKLELALNNSLEAYTSGRVFLSKENSIYELKENSKLKQASVGGNLALINLSDLPENHFVRIVVTEGELAFISYAVINKEGDIQGFYGISTENKNLKPGEWYNITTVDHLNKLAGGQAEKLVVALNYKSASGYLGTRAKADIYLGLLNVSEKIPEPMVVNLKPGNKIKLGTLINTHSNDDKLQAESDNYIVLSTENLKHSDLLILENIQGEIEDIIVETITKYDNGNIYISNITKYLPQLEKTNDKIVYSLKYDSIYKNQLPIRISLKHNQEANSTSEASSADLYLANGEVKPLFTSNDFSYKTLNQGISLQYTTDSHGNNHYLVNNYDGVYYLTDQKGKWHRELLQKREIWDIPFASEMFVDNFGTIHAFVYKSSTSDDLIYFKNQDNSWETTATLFLSQSKIKVTPNGNVHIIGTDNQRLKYIRNNNGQLTSQDLGASNPDLKLGNFVVDDQNRVHLVYIDNQNKEIIYCRISDTDVTKEIVYKIPENRPGFINSPLLSAESQERINSISKEKVTADTGYFTEYYAFNSSIILAQDTSLHIAYQFYRNRVSPGGVVGDACLNYATNQLGSWENFFIDGGQTAMALYGANSQIWEDKNKTINILADRPNFKKVHLKKVNNLWHKDEFLQTNIEETIFINGAKYVLYQTPEKGLVLATPQSEHVVDPSPGNYASMFIKDNIINIYYEVYDNKLLQSIVRHAWKNTNE